MRIIYTICFICFYTLLTMAQSRVFSSAFNKQHVYLRTPQAVILDSLEIDFPNDGKLWLKVDGTASISFGDVITLAVSNNQGWETNDGNTNVFAVDSAHLTSAFGHSRTYSVEKGKSKFYAVAQNWTDRYGTGYADVWGSLVAMYEPAEDENADFEGQGFYAYPFGIESTPKIVTTINVNPENAEKICVYYEGLHYGVNNDEIEFAITADGVFPQHQYNGVLGITSGYDGRYLATQNCFLPDMIDSAVFLMAKKHAGNFTENQNGIYSNFTVNYMVSAFQTFNKKLAHTAGDMADFEFVAPQKGKLLIKTTGHITSDGVSSAVIDLHSVKEQTPGENALKVQSFSAAYKSEYFSLCRLTEVTPGANHFYLSAFTEGGSDSLNIAGEITLQFIPNAVVSGTSANKSLNLSAHVFPNPGKELLFISLEDQFINGVVNVMVFDAKGQRVASKLLDFPNENSLDVSGLISGLYHVVIQTAHAVFSNTYMHD